MKIQITCKGLEHTPELDEHIHKHSEKIMRLLEHERSPVTVEFVIEHRPSHAHYAVHLHIISPAYEVNVQREGQKLYPVFDEVLHIAHDALHKEKARHVHDHKQGPHRPG